MAKEILPGEFLLKGDDARYQNSHDVQLRLFRSFVRFEDKPYYVQQILDDCKIHLLEKDGSLIVSSNDSRLDISSMRLGMVEDIVGPLYVYRAPNRHQTQGVNFYTSRGVRLGVEKHMTLTPNHIYPFLDLFNQNYRKIDQILRETPTKGGAFSRTWAFVPSKNKNIFKLFHRDVQVGFFLGLSSRFIFSSGMATSLRIESLQNILNKQGHAYGSEYSIETL